jgi:hypothetical protein
MSPEAFLIYVLAVLAIGFIYLSRVKYKGAIITRVEIVDACFETNTGSISIDVKAGPTPHFNWSNFVSGLDKNKIDNLAPGKYSVTVTNNAAGTKATKDIVVGKTFLSVVVNTLPTSAHSVDGSIKAQINGSGSYTFEWNNGENVQQLDNIGPGVYKVMATSTDVTGCSGTGSVKLLPNYTPPCADWSADNPKVMNCLAWTPFLPPPASGPDTKFVKAFLMSYMSNPMHPVFRVEACGNGVEFNNEYQLSIYLAKGISIGGFPFNTGIIANPTQSAPFNGLASQLVTLRMNLFQLDESPMPPAVLMKDALYIGFGRYYLKTVQEINDEATNMLGCGQYLDGTPVDADGFEEMRLVLANINELGHYLACP